MTNVHVISLFMIINIERQYMTRLIVKWISHQYVGPSVWEREPSGFSQDVCNVTRSIMQMFKHQLATWRTGTRVIVSTSSRLGLVIPVCVIALEVTFCYLMGSQSNPTSVIQHTELGLLNTLPFRKDCELLTTTDVYLLTLLHVCVDWDDKTEG